MKISRALLISLSLFSLAAVPTGCQTKQLPPALTDGPDREKTLVKFEFEIPSEQPAYLQSAQSLSILITPRTGTASSAKIPLTLTANSATLKHEISAVNTGSVEISIQVLDAEDTVLQEVQRSFTLVRGTDEPFVVTLGERMTLEVPNALSSKSLSQLLQQEQDILKSIQSLEQQRSVLRGQAQALIGSNAPEDRALRDQIQSEIQVIETSLATQNAELSQVRATALNAQSSLEGQASESDRVALNTAQLSYDRARSDLETLIAQRSTLRTEFNAAVSTGDLSRQQALQGEIDGLSTQIDRKFFELAQLADEIRNLQARIDQSESNLSDSERKQRLEAEIAQLQSDINQLDREISDLNGRIEILVVATDQQSIDRREALEREKASKEESRSQKQTALITAEAQLSALEN